MTLPKTPTSRADLLRLLAVHQEVPLAATRAAGYAPTVFLPVVAASGKPEQSVPNAAEVLLEAEPVSGGEGDAKRFWRLHRRQNLRLHLSSLSAHSLRHIRPLRRQELSFPDADAAHDFRLPPPQPRRQGKANLLARHVKAAAQLRPFRRLQSSKENKPGEVLPSARQLPTMLALELIRAGQQPHSPVWRLKQDWLEQFALRLLRTWQEQQRHPGLLRYVRQLLAQVPESVSRQAVWPGLLYGMAHCERLRAGAAMPPEYRPEAVMSVVQKTTPPTAYLLVQEGEELVLVQAPDAGICLLKGSRIAALELCADLLLLDRGGQLRTVPVQTQRPICSLTAGLRLQTQHEILEIKPCTRPVWAHLIGRNSRDLFAEISWLGRKHRLYWQIPAAGGQGRWKSYHSPVGMDEFGLHTELSLDGTVMQRFRWLDPGRFMMGSPPEEPEREVWGKETLHEVVLSRGFWLADTAVTQSLWQAVTGTNPARFKGGQHPAENVSWLDVQDFLVRLNAVVPGLNARLPTEAEWEYGCRAGTATPFAFGGSIAPDLANCSSGYPGRKEVSAQFRRQTVAVKSLPANAWGLHEMHGNVWEWCQDYWQDDLLSEPVTDPQGPANGDFRAVRGGSWFLSGRGVRSAVRGRFAPGFRNDRLGFRLARSHEIDLEPGAG